MEQTKKAKKEKKKKEKVNHTSVENYILRDPYMHKQNDTTCNNDVSKGIRCTMETTRYIKRKKGF